MKTVLLKDIASIRVGLIVSRKQADAETPYKYQRLSLKSMLENGRIDLGENEPFFAVGKMDPAFLTQKGMVLIKLFAPLNPVLVGEKEEGLLIPSQIAAITVQKGILPGYIRLLLAQEPVINYLLSRHSPGTVLRPVSIKTLLELPIAIPSPKKQESLCNLHELYSKKHHLLDEIEKREDLIIQNAFSKILKAAGV
jgi:hypothetical protein